MTKKGRQWKAPSTKTEIYFMRNCRKLRRNTSDRQRAFVEDGVVGSPHVFSALAQLPSSLSSQSPSHITDMHHIKAVPITSLNSLIKRLADHGDNFEGAVELSYSEVESPPKP